MFRYLRQIWNSKDLKQKIFFTIFAIIIYRLVAHITVPGVDPKALQVIFQQSNLLGIFALFTGGSIQNFSIILMGLSPYINASIIMQLMTVVVPSLEALSKEGERGYRQINRYTHWLTFPLAFLQSYGMVLLLNRSSLQGGQPLIENINDPAVILPIMLYITTGTIFLVWLGELITEKGIGNGVSFLIFAGIVADMPAVFGRILGISQFDSSKLIPFIIFVIITVLMMMAIILFTEGHRNIPITYAGHLSPRGEKSGLPIRVNQAGMIPIIFAISLITFPGIIAQFLQSAKTMWIREAANFLSNNFSSVSPSYFYLVAYFALIIAFSFFYVSVTFNANNIAENIQKRGGFIPGIRPGRQTADFLAKTSNHLNLFGGIFLGIVAVIPILFTKFTTLSSGDLIISGSGLIIIVGVVLDLIRQINAQLVMHDYEKFY